MRLRSRTVLVCLAAFMLACCGAFAATIEWDGGVSGTETNWHTDANWGGDTKPGSSDSAEINIGDADVTFTENEEIQYFLMGDVTGTYTQTLRLLSGTLTCNAVTSSDIGNRAGVCSKLYIDGGTLDVSVGLGGLSMGDAEGSTGILEMTGGTLIVTGNSCIVGNSGYGEATFSGGTTRSGDWDGALSRSFNVGAGGTGEGLVIITNGAVVTHGGYFMVGAYGSGTMNIYSGAFTNKSDNRHSWIGQYKGSSGTLNIYGGSFCNDAAGDQGIGSGDGSYSTNLSVGTINLYGGTCHFVKDEVNFGENSNGVGRLNISGGVFKTTSAHMYFGRNANSTGTLHLTGGTIDWPVGEYFQIGRAGYGKMIIDGAATTCTNGRFGVGNAAGGYGELIISNGYCLVYANSGIGQVAGSTGVLIQSGGTLYADSDFAVGDNNTGYGSYTMSSGTLSVNALEVAGKSSVMTVSGDAFVTNRSGAFLETGAGTGTLCQTGGEIWVNGEAWIGRNTDTEFNISGGELHVGFFRFGGNNSKLTISGGSVECTDNCTYGYGEPATVQIIGSGCTNIDFGGLFDFDDGDADTNTVRAFLDSGGISLWKINGNTDLRNIKFEIGVTNGFEGALGSTYEFVRVPQASSIQTDGWAIANLDSTYQFKAYVTNYSSYDWILIECTNAPSYPSIFTFR